MKRFYLIVFTVLFSFSFAAYASVESLLKAPVAQQSYQSAGAPATSNKKESYAEQLAKVRAIMEKSKQEVADGSLKQKPSASQSITDHSTNPEESKELESQMNQIHQVDLQFHKSTNAKIESLVSQNKIMATRLQKLTQAMQIMNQQLSSISQHSQMNPTKMKSTHHAISVSEIFNYSAFGLAVLLAVFMGVLISRQKKES